MTDACRICEAEPALAAANGLAEARRFPAPAFDGHLVVATKAHKDLADVTPEEWQGIGEIIGKLSREAGASPDFEKHYLLAIGDADKGHFHLHLVPKRTDEPGLGPFIFGPEGWNAKRGT